MTVKSEVDSRWATYPRFVAEQFAERCGIAIPTNGVRIIVTDPQRIDARLLDIKPRGGQRRKLTNWVKAERTRLASAAQSQ